MLRFSATENLRRLVGIRIVSLRRPSLHTFQLAITDYKCSLSVIDSFQFSVFFCIYTLNLYLCLNHRVCIVIFMFIWSLPILVLCCAGDRAESIVESRYSLASARSSRGTVSFPAPRLLSIREESESNVGDVVGNGLRLPDSARDALRVDDLLGDSDWMEAADDSSFSRTSPSFPKTIHSHHNHQRGTLESKKSSRLRGAHSEFESFTGSPRLASALRSPAIGTRSSGRVEQHTRRFPLDFLFLSFFLIVCFCAYLSTFSLLILS